MEDGYLCIYRAREDWVQDVPQHVSDYLARGGRIQVIPPGVTAYNPAKRLRPGKPKGEQVGGQHGVA
jgi:hypothetical protein